MSGAKSDNLTESWVVMKYTVDHHPGEIFRAIGIEHPADEDVDFEGYVASFLSAGMTKDWQKRCEADFGRWEFSGYSVLNQVEFETTFPEKARIHREIAIHKNRIKELVAELDQLT